MMTSPNNLCPTVESYEGERLTFWVKSRSGQPKYIVDMESNEGLGECNCPAYRYRKNRDCHHIQEVRKLLACALAQEILRKI